MKNLLRTTDPTLIAFVSALLDGEGIESWHLDVHMSVLDGGIGALPQRLVVREDDYNAAERVLRDHKIDSGY
jgi:Putative prokaryotic signal transducing protein